MSFKQALVGAVSGAALAAGVPALAHHSFASEFDANRPVEVVGVVKEMRFSNPHSWIYITVKTDSGEIQDWAFEGAAPNALLRRACSSARRVSARQAIQPPKAAPPPSSNSRPARAQKRNVYLNLTLTSAAAERNEAFLS
jgi:hypothetical protein